jgi:hypothetical protein
VLKRIFKISVWIGRWVVLAGLLSACATGGEERLRQNLGDPIVSRLQIGMTSGEVDAAIGDLRKYVTSDDLMKIDSEDQIFSLYRKDYYPKGLLSSVTAGTPYRVLGYRTSGVAGGSLLLFFDDGAKRLRGWANAHSQQSIDKFMHEQVTSLLKVNDGYNKGMTHAQVHALIGPPAEIILPPRTSSRAQYEDHFWTKTPPLLDVIKQLEVYTYPLSNGEKRRVYLGYYRNPDQLVLWGYDHAWNEAERYLREKVQQK